MFATKYLFNFIFYQKKTFKIYFKFYKLEEKKKPKLFLTPLFHKKENALFIYQTIKKKMVSSA